MIPPPKDRFLANVALAKHHADTVGTSQFAVALDAALLQYGEKCSKDENGALLLRGAYEFTRIFCDLSEKRTEVKPVDRDNL